MKFDFNLPKIGAKRVAIDWGSSALKIVAASKLKESYLITDFIYQKVEEDLPKTIFKIWHEKKLPLYNIVLSLDGAATLVRVVDFPRMEKKLIRDSLGFELSRYIPFSQEEVYFDFSVLDTGSAAGNMKLLVASAKKDFVDEKIATLEEAGIVPSKITLSPISLANVFLKFFPHTDEPIGILDLGFSYSMITIVYKNNIYLSREVKKGVKDILARLSNKLGREIKGFQGIFDKKNEVGPSLLSEVSSDLLEEIRLSLDYMETKENLSVKNIYATGGFTACQGLNEVLVQALGIEITSFDVLKSFSYTSSIKKELEEMEGNFSVAISSLL
ncbi:MAG: pilus assembly protein PilM [Candidatus Omnitrophica bacterium]|nr:pilus assembly protein PilM [Candidatus Omnitrophota bacterium]